MSKKITVYSLMLSKSLRKTFLQTTLLRHLAYLRELLVAEQYPEQFALFHFSLGRLRGIGVARDRETGMVRFPTELGELLSIC